MHRTTLYIASFCIDSRISGILKFEIDNNNGISIKDGLCKCYVILQSSISITNNYYNIQISIKG